MEVLTPTSKTVQNYIGNRLLVYLYREFRSNEKPGQPPPRVPADELLSQFPLLTEGFMRKRLKHCADLQVCTLNRSTSFSFSSFRKQKECSISMQLW